MMRASLFSSNWNDDLLKTGDAKASLIMLAQLNYQHARWWQLAAAWVFGRHQIVRHLGRVARVSFWRNRPYLLSFRETI